jgi:hypothetical protein
MKPVVEIAKAFAFRRGNFQQPKSPVLAALCPKIR